jgi:hypothetical protein
MMFVKDSKTVILMKKGHAEEKENKLQRFKKKILIRGPVYQNLDKSIRFKTVWA